MTVKAFMKQFTKDEILDALFTLPEFKRIGRRICCALWEKKSDRLLKEMDGIVEKSKECRTAIQLWENNKALEKVDAQLDKLTNDFEKLEW